MPDETVADRLARIVATEGPIPVSTYLDHALYGGPAGEGGFYLSGGRAGKRGDFLTAPEVGPLFGAVVAAALERWWLELGEPDPFTVLEWGAGPGTLARSALDALTESAPGLAAAGALRWVLIERSEAQRALHPVHPQVESVPTWAGPQVDAGVVLANELLDNLVFDIVEGAVDGWAEVRLRPGAEAGVFDDVLVPLPDGQPAEFADTGAAPGTRLPWQRAARDWLADARRAVARGRVVVFDYGAPTAELVARDGAWLRTHAGHEHVPDWRRDPGSCDITADVDTDQLQREAPADSDRSQAEWLGAHGIDALVERGREVWEATAGIGDLTALKARSRVREAEALTDPTGMGAFRVLEWVVDGK